MTAQDPALPICPTCNQPPIRMEAEIREERLSTDRFTRKYPTQAIYTCEAGHTWKIRTRYYQPPQS